MGWRGELEATAGSGDEPNETLAGNHCIIVSPTANGEGEFEPRSNVWDSKELQALVSSVQRSDEANNRSANDI